MTLVPRRFFLRAALLLAFVTGLSSAEQSEAAEPSQLPQRRAARSIDDIRSVFDTKSAQITAIYNRFLRENPTLSGKIVLEMHIAPSGVVTECSVVANETKSEALQKALVNEARMFDFGTRDVAPMVVRFPIEFLP